MTTAVPGPGGHQGLHGQDLEELADQGDPLAICKLAWGVQKSELDRSVKLYRKAAEMGRRGSMYNLACLIQDVDPIEANEWFERAAKLGDPGAKRAVGHPSAPRRGLKRFAVLRARQMRAKSER